MMGKEIPPAQCFQELAGLYSEPHRHYHNQHHIADCLAEFDGVKALAANPVAVELAIWFHDAIYDTRASDNEERSAELAQRWLKQFGADAALMDAVGRLILATKNHDGSLHPDAPLLVDVDLSILGQPPVRFWKYEKQIRAEYAWVDAMIFATKRAEILRRFLARPRLYQTAHFFERFEAQARKNLQVSVERLSSGTA
jgi:predicted metal-dependent HD superfamily phosphohydrolase